MSLAVLADHLASKGRNGDSMLVHMTPEEVHGLHALALAHGGKLTINPETGLPEASFLKSLLPMIAGFALAPLTAGTSLAFLGATPLASALTVGAVTGLATGSLQKGIMAGLGAYGGASLGAGLTQAGMAGIQSAAGEAAAKTAADQLALTGTLGQEEAAKYVQQQVAAKAAATTPFEAMKAGISGLGSEAGRQNLMAAFGSATGAGGLSGLARAGMMAAAPVIADQAVQTATPMPGGQRYQGTIRPYKFDPYSRTWTAQPTYPAVPVNTAAQPNPQEQQPPGGYNTGGIVALADGGVPDLSGLSAGQRKYAEDLMTRQGQGTPQEIFDYVKGLNDYQALASLAATQGKQGWNKPSGFESMNVLGADYGVPEMSYGMGNIYNINTGQTTQGAPAQGAPAQGGLASLAAQPATLTPDQFKQRIYQGGADDVLATQRGVDYIRQAGLTPQQSLDLWNQSLGTNFGMADYDRVMKQFPATPTPAPVTPTTPPPIVSGPSVPGTQGPSVTFGGDTTIPEYTAPVTKPTLGEAFQPTPQTMEQVRTGYEQGGGSTRMPTITDIKPGERTYTLNAVADMITGFLQQNPNAQYGEVQKFAQSKGIPEMQARAAYNEFRFSTMTGGTKQAYDYLMGRTPYSAKPFVPGGGPIAVPYAEAMGLTGGTRFRPTMPPRGGEGGGEGGGSTTGGTTNTTNQSALERLRGTFDKSIFSKTPEEKAAYYNSLLAAGYDDATIRAAIDAPLDDNWLALRAIAERLRAGTTDTTGTTRTTGGGTTTTGGGGVTTLLGGSNTRIDGTKKSDDTKTNTDTSTDTPITDFLFGKQDPNNVPVVDRSTRSIDSVLETEAADRAAERAHDEAIRQLEMQNERGYEPGYDYDVGAGYYGDRPDTGYGYDYDVGTGYYGGSRYNPEEYSNLFRKGGLADVAAAAASHGGQIARYNLGGYSDGGRLLRGPGDGVSDSIPATIGNKQPARLADGEFVIPARIVSEIGNGSTEAGARKLYAMMDRVQRARAKTTGKGKVAKNTRAEKYLPA